MGEIFRGDHSAAILIRLHRQASASGISLRQHLGRGNDTRHPGAGMRSRPDQIQALRLFRDVVRAEPGRLQDARLDRETGAQRAEVSVAEGFRREDQRGRQVVAQPRQHLLFQHLLHLLPVGLRLGLPIDRIGMAQMRHAGQRVEGVVPRRGDARIGHAGAMDIQRHVVGQLALHEDVIDQPLVARAVQDGVMADVGPHAARALGAEVPDEQPHRPARAFQPGRGPALARAHCAAGGHRCGPHRRSTPRCRTRRTVPSASLTPVVRPSPDQDFIHLGIQQDRAALLFDHAGHRLGDRRTPPMA